MRLTPEREKAIREFAFSDFGLTVTQELLAEIDALRVQLKHFETDCNCSVCNSQFEASCNEAWEKERGMEPRIL